MIYEHRSYTMLPGKRWDFFEIFSAKLAPLFEKYGAKLVGAWETDIGESNEFIYILAFEDFAKRDQFWKSFRQDKAYLEYHRQGPYAANVTNKILRAIRCSPLK